MLNYEKYLQSYEFVSILPGSQEEIKYRPLTTNDLKKVLVYENQQDPLLGEVILDQIVTSAVLNEQFSIDELYIQDRYFLFIELRKATKGTVHTFPYTCNNCSSQSIQKVDLDQLETKNLDRESIESVVELMDGNIKLEMDFITRKEQKEAYKTISKNLTSTQKQVEMVIADIACSIKSITTPDGTDKDIPIKKKMESVGNLPGNQYDIIKNWFQENQFGIDLNVSMICPHCGEGDVTTMPLDNFFE